MFERRPIWGLILGLNVCILIWLISVQEPAILDAEAVGGGTGSGYVSVANLPQQTDSSIYSYDKPQHQQSPHLPKPPQTQQPQVPNDWLASAELQLQQQQNQPQQRQHQHEHQQPYAGKHLLSERQASAQTIESTLAIALSSKTKESVSRIKRKKDAGGGKKRSIISSKKNHINNNNKTLALSSFNLKIMNTATPTPLVTEATPSNSSTLAFAADFSPSANDFAQLIDLHNFYYLMEQPVCGHHIDGLILVHSAPGNFDKRQFIRESWGSPAILEGSVLRLIFLLGAVSERSLQLRLEGENKAHGDLVQGSFVDNYRNMTYKHVMAFKWFLYNCAHAQILIKVDDDVFVNTPQLLKSKRLAVSSTTTTDRPPTIDTDIFGAYFDESRYFSAKLFLQPRNLLFCDPCYNAAVKRSYRSKWRVSFKEYSGAYYPTYCPGYAIIYSRDVALRLYTAVQNYKYFWVDDVHITGSMAKITKTNITSSNHFVLFPNERYDSLLNGKLAYGDVEFIFAWHSISPYQMCQLWNKWIRESYSSTSLRNCEVYQDSRA